MAKSKVSSGEYADESEVFRAGLRALRERETVIDDWLRDEVAPAYDAVQADPSRARSLADIRASLADEHERPTNAG